MKRTVAEIAAELAIEADGARGLVKFLLATDPPLVRFRGERPSARGRGAAVYEIEMGAGAQVRRLLERLE